MGVIGVATATLMRGPVGTVMALNLRAKVDSQLEIARKLIALDAANNAGDCDSDGFIEPAPPDTGPGCNITLPGGGCIPSSIGAAKTDPWGTMVGYCAWNHGPKTSGSGCPAGLLVGTNGTSKTVIAVISAGADRQFQSTCGNDPAYVTKGGDDIVEEWTFSEAQTLSGGGLWTLMSGNPNAITTSKNVDIANNSTFASGTTATFQGNADFGAGSKLSLASGALLNLPTQVQLPDSMCSGAAAAANDGVLRVNTTAGRTLQICNPTALPSAAWINIGGSGTVTKIDDLTDAVSDFATGGNLFLGNGGGNLIVAGSAADNVAVGVNAGLGMTIGKNNLLLGYNAGHAISTGNNNIIINPAATDNTAIAVTSNLLDIGSLIYGVLPAPGGGAVGIGTATPGATLDVNGSLKAGSAAIGGALTAASAGISGAATVGDTLAVTNGATLGGTLSVAGNVSSPGGTVTIASGLDTTGSAAFENTVTVAGAATLNNTLTVIGAATLDSDLAVLGHAAVTGAVGGASYELGVIGSGNGLLPDSAANLKLKTASGLLEILGSGNVGIGVANPQTPLDVNGPIKIGQTGAGCSAPIYGAIRYSSVDDKFQICSKDGSWETVGTSGGGGGGGGSTSAAGTAGDVQYNSGGIMGASGNFVYTSAGRLGVGTGAPAARVHVSGGDFLNNGSYTGTASVLVSGAGTRLFFEPATSALRAGTVTGSDWDNGVIGNYSTAFGQDTTANGTGSMSWGQLNNANGALSTAWGLGTTAKGGASTAFGQYTLASGGASTALGQYVYAGDGVAGNGKGDYSLAIGLTNTGTTNYAEVTGTGALGIFMQDQSNKVFAANNTMGLFGGRFVLDPNTHATLLAPNANTDMDVNGNIGSVNYCDVDGNNCFTAADISGGITGAPGSDRDVMFNSGGRLGAYPTFVFTSAGRLGIGTAAPTSNLFILGKATQGTAPVVTIQGGADQVGGNPLQTWNNAAGTPVASLSVSGTLVGGAFINSAGNFSLQSGALLLGNAQNIGFSSTAAYSGALDVNLSRLAAGKIGVGNGTQGDFTGTLIAGSAGIGLSNPATALDVNGAVRVGFDANCAIGTIGAVRYLAAGDKVQYCASKSGTYVWTDMASSGTAGAAAAVGVQGNVQYNSGGVMGANANFTFTSAGRLGVGTASPLYSLDVTGTGAGQDVEGNIRSTSPTGYAGILLNENNSNHYSQIFRTNSGNSNYGGGGSLNIYNTDNAAVAFFTAGLERARITGAGNIGIGTTAPAGMLEVRNPNANASILLVYNSANTNILGLTNTGNLSANNLIGIGNGFRYDGTGAQFGNTGRITWGSTSSYASTLDTGISRLSAGVLAAGNGTQGDYTGTFIAGLAGIGTTTPYTKLEVAGTVKIGDGNETCNSVNYAGGIRYTSAKTLQYCDSTKWQTVASTGAGGVTAAGSDRQVQFNSGGKLTANANFTFTSAGRLGVGTASPGATLDLGAVGGYVNTWSNSTGYLFNSRTYSKVFYDADNSAYYVDPNGATSAILSGTVGIGTTTPGAKLDVGGSFYLNRPSVMVDPGNTIGTGANYIKIAPNSMSASNAAYLDIGFPDNTTAAFYTDYDGNIRTSGTSFRDIQFGRISAPYVTFKDGGNVGIGTTTPSTLLSLGGNAAQTMGMERTTGTTGNTLTVKSGGAVLLGTDLNGGNLALSSGIATGDGSSSILFQTVKTHQGPGTADRNPATSMTLASNALTLPSGPTSEQPGQTGMQASVPGMIRYDSSSGKFEAYQSGAWQDILTSASGNQTAWSALTAPTGSLSLTMGANTSLFTYNSATGSSDLFKLLDTTGNTGTGYLLNVSTASGSHANPLHLSAQGTTDLVFTSAGRLGIGTAGPGGTLDVGTGQLLVSSPGTGNQSAPSIANRGAPATGINITSNTVDLDFANYVWHKFGTNGWQFSLTMNSLLTQPSNTVYPAQSALLMTGGTITSPASATPTSFQLANTYTDATHFEAGMLSWAKNANVLTLLTDKGSASGSYRDIAIAPGGAISIYAAVGGNVGIGTASPSQKLDITGNILLDNISGLGIRGVRPSDSAQSNILFEQNGNSGNLLADATVLSSVGNAPIQLLPNAGANVGLTLLSGGNLGIGTSTPSTLLSLNGEAAQTIGQERTALGITGYGLTVKSGGAVLLGTDLNGGNLALSSGIATGNGSSSILFQTVKIHQGPGTADRNPATSMTLASNALTLPSGPASEQPGQPGMQASVPGMIRYDSGSGKFQAYQGVSWQDILTSGAGGVTWNSITSPAASQSLTMGANTSLFTYNATTGSSDLFKLLDTTNNTGTGYLLNVSTASGSHANPLHLSAQGTTDLVFTSAGRLGVGTTAPSVGLEVNSAAKFDSTVAIGGTVPNAQNSLYINGANTRAILINNAATGTNQTDGTYMGQSGGSDFYIDNQENGAFILYTNNTETMRLTAAGNLVIGSGEASATPSGNTLRGPNGVGSNIAGGSLTLQGGLATGNAATGDISFNGAPVGGSGATAQTAATYMTIKGGGATAGKVGIGLTNPTLKLQVYDATSSGLRLGDGTNYIDVINDAGSSQRIASSAALFYLGKSGNSLASFVQVDGTNANAQNLYVPAGNVGIGTTSPLTQLQVFGNSGSTTTMGSATISNQGLALINTYAAQNQGYYGIQFGGYTGFAHSGLFGVITNNAGNTTGDLVISSRHNTADATFTENMRVQGSTGKVGIGLTSPAANTLLDVNGNVGATQYCDVNGNNCFVPGSGGSVAAAGSNKQVQFNSGGVMGADANFNWDRVNGRLGIGTASPQRLLHLTGNYAGATTFIGLENTNVTDGTGQVISFRGPTTGAGAASFVEYSAIQNSITLHDNATHTSDLSFWTSNAGAETQAMMIKSNGNLGIGTASPATILDIGGGTNYTDVNATYQFYATGAKILQVANAGQSALNLVSGINTDGGVLGALAFSRSLGQSDAHYNVAGIQAIQKGTGATAGGQLQFWTKLNGSANTAPVAVIDNNGNFGIGTAAPSALLHIYKASGTNIPVVQTGDATGDTGWSMQNTGATWQVLNRTGSRLGFWNNSGTGEVATMLNNGNVGIGTTAPNYKFDVGSIGGSQTATSGAGGLIRNNMAADTSPYTQARLIVYGGTAVDTTNWGYFGYGADASMREVYAKTGGGAPLLWGTSSAMDGTGTFTETMRLTTAGKVGIGFTAPAANTLLDVNGNVGATQYCDASGNNCFVPGSGGTVAAAGSTKQVQFNSGGVMGADSNFNWDNTNKRLGIGTTTPGFKLETNGNGKVGGLVFQASDPGNVPALWTNTSAVYLQSVSGDWATADYSRGNGLLVGGGGGSGQLQTAGQTTLAVTTGNVGIGTTSPFFKLQVAGGPSELTTTDFNNTSTGSNIYLNLAATTGNTYGILGSANTGGTVAGTLAIMPYGGNVGIGTATPGEKLDVNGNIHLPTTSYIAGLSAPYSNGYGGFLDFTGTCCAIDATHGGYGAWLNYNAYFDGSNWIQPRGSLGSYMFTTNYHAGGWAWYAMAAGGTDGGTITPSRVGALDGSGNLSVNGTGTFGTNAVINGGGASYFNGGNVGIGTTGPNAKLEVDGQPTWNNETTADIKFVNTAPSPVKVLQLGYDNSIDAAYLYSYQSSTGVKPLVINPSGGKVGIGTTSPAANTLLDVNGNVGATQYCDAAGNNCFVPGSGSTVAAAGSTKQVQFNSGGVMGADSNFNWDNTNKRLGIGTAAPGYRLDIGTLSGSVEPTSLKISGGATAGLQMRMGNDYSGSIGTRYSGADTFVASNAFQSTLGADAWAKGVGTYSSAMAILGISSSLTSPAFQINYSPANTSAGAMGAFFTSNLFSILGNGNVGIGTTSPASKLNVSGGLAVGSAYNAQAAADGNVIASTGIGINFTAPVYEFETRETAASGVNVWRVLSSGNANRLTLASDGSDNLALYMTAATGGGAVNFSTNGNSYLTGGNVGIGVTGPTSPLDVRLNSASSNVIAKFINPGSDGASYETQMLMGSDNGTDHSAAWNYYENATASSRYMNFQLYGEAAGVGLNIVQGGNVGIGTASPEWKLDTLDTTSTNRVAILRRGTQGPDGSMVTSFGTPYLSIGGTEYRGNSIQTIGFGWSSGGTTIQPAEIGFQTTNTASYTSGDIVFANRNGTTNVAPAEIMRLTSTGKVGIGFTAPNANTLLDVNGNVGAVQYCDVNGNNCIVPGSGGTVSAAGSAKQVQFNSGGVMGADSGFNWDNTNKRLGVGTTTPGSPLEIDTQQTAGQTNDFLTLYTPNAQYSDAWMAFKNNTNGVVGRIGIFSPSETYQGLAMVVGSPTINSSMVPNLFINYQGKIEINTQTQPYTQFTVSGNAGLTSNNEFRFYAGDNTHYGSIRNSLNNNSLTFSFGGADNMVMTNAGLVGIGTTAPGAFLQVNPTQTVTTDTTMLKSGIVYNGGSAMTNWYGAYVAAPTGTGAITNKYALVTEAGAGNVGIGTTAPVGKLEVYGGNIVLGASSAELIAQGLGYDCSGCASYTTFQPYSPSTGYTILNNQAYGIRLQTAGTDKLTILNGGNVGIGTATPGTKVDIQGTNTTLTGNISGNTQTNLAVMTTDAQAMDVGGALGFGGKYTSGGAQALFGAIAGRKATSTDASTAGYLSFLTTNSVSPYGLTEWMRITSTGNVGIGTTAPNATEPYSRLTVQSADGTANAMAIINAGAGQNGLIINRTGTTPSRWYEYIPSGSSDLRLFNGADLVTFQAAGNVGIGTTSPTGALQINGSGTSESPAVPNTLTVANGTTPAYRIYMGYDTTHNGGVIAAVETAVTWENLLLEPYGGKVGIGLTAPAANTLLDVNGNVGAAQYCDAAGNNCFVPGSGGTVSAAGSDRQVQFNSGGNLGAKSTFVFTSAGRLGIGTATPSAPLHVIGGASNNTVGEIAGTTYSINGSNYGSFGANSRVGLVGSANYAGQPNLPTNPLGAQWAAAGVVGIGGGNSGSAYGIGVAGFGQSVTAATGLTAGGKFLANTSGNLNTGENLYGVYAQADGTTNTTNADSVYGIYASGVGQGTDVTYGGYFSATGGTSNYGLVVASGNVGIGTTSPAQLLSVNGTTPNIYITDTAQTAPAGVFTINDSSDNLTIYRGTLGSTAVAKFQMGNGQNTTNSLGVQAISAGSFTGTNLTYFPTSGSSYINNGGNVGIGTAAPSQLLHVSGASPEVLLRSTGTGLRGLWTTVDDTNSVVSFNSSFNTVGAYPITFQMGNGEVMRIAATGNVGIGTTSPGTALEVNGNIRTTTSSQSIGARYNSGNDNYLTSIIWNSTAGGVLTLGNNGVNEIRAGRTAVNGYLKFMVNNTAADTTASDGTEAMRILANGNVGIGTAGPTQKLDINGNLNIGSGVIYNGAHQLNLQNSYPSITTNGTNYYKGLDIQAYDLPISTGVTESGYRIGLGIQSFVSDTNFLGTLADQRAVWARHGANVSGAGSTISNSYGVYIEELTDANTTITNAYGVYQVSAGDKNYFAGNVGIGTTTPASKLDVNGEVRIGNTGLACSGTTEGAQQYNGTLHVMDYCNGTSWTALAGQTTGPLAFSFTDQTGVTASTTITSNTVTLTGFSGSLTATCSSCTAIAHNGSWGGTSVTGFVNGDTIAIRQTSSASAGTATTATATVGGTTSGTWTVTTSASGPSAFSFTDVTGATIGITYTSNTVTLSGFTGPVSATCNTCTGIARNGVWGVSPVTGFVNGDTIAIRQTSSTGAGVATTTNVTVGSTTSGTWTVTTATACSVGIIVGQACPDGTIFAGTSPDGSVPMYTTVCDSNQYWNGSACTACATGQWSGSGSTCNTTYTRAWNNGTGNWTVTGYTSATTGKANTAGLALLVDAGSPYNAADYCKNLTAYGNSDWYLPAQNELSVMYTNRAAIAHFDTTDGSTPVGGAYPGLYWTSTEYNLNGAWIQRFSDGNQLNYVKSSLFAVRCVRR